MIMVHHILDVLPETLLIALGVAFILCQLLASVFRKQGDKAREERCETLAFYLVAALFVSILAYLLATNAIR